MRAFAFLAALVLLAGCADSGGKGDDDSTTTTSASGTGSGTSTGTSSGTATGTSTGAPGANTPPTANVTADVDNGTAPLVVNFTLDASDADGDALNWTFDADGDGTPELNGTALPATFQHTFNESGEFRAALNVSDGKTSITAFRLIVVAEGDGGDAGGLVDRGEYFFEPATGHCHAKDYTEEAPGVYSSGYGGGNWFFVEDNDVDGLQYEDNHPLKDVPNAGFGLAVGADCVDGDQTAV